MRMPGRLLWMTAAAACAVAAAMPAAAAGGPPFPQPGAQSSPPGANVGSCRPSAAHPRPVVLVHGLGADMSENWSYISPLLAAQGYCVFALTYGVDPRATIPPFDQMGGVVPMEQSAVQLSTFVNQVLTTTGAPRVDIVGHSEGSLMPDWYARFLDGAGRIDRYVGITPLWQGTDTLGLATMEQYGRGPGLSPPVVAGVGQMSYRRFVSFNVIGGIAWVVSMTMLGFSLGSVYPGITKQIDKVVIVIIAVSLIPGAISYLMNRKKTPPNASHFTPH